MNDEHEEKRGKQKTSKEKKKTLSDGEVKKEKYYPRKFKQVLRRGTK